MALRARDVAVLAVVLVGSAPSYGIIYSDFPVELLVSNARGGMIFPGPGGQVVAAYLHPDGISTDIYVGAPHGSGSITTLPPYKWVITGAGSGGGVVLNADNGGFISNFYYFVSATGAVTLRPGVPSIPSECTGFSIASDGQIGFIGRNQFNTGPNLACMDNPSAGDSSAHQVDTSTLISTTSQNFGNSTLIDSQGRMILARFPGTMLSSATVYRRDPADWATMPQSGVWLRLLDIATNDRFVYSVNRPNPTIYRSDRPTTPLCTLSGTDILNAGIGDNGAIVAATLSQTVYVTPEGNVIDFGALTGSNSVGQISINSRGEAAFVMQGNSPGLWLFDGSSLSLVATNIPEVPLAGSVDPTLLLTDNDEIYFFGVQPGDSRATQLFRITVPEPSSVAAWMTLLALTSCARRKRGMRVTVGLRP